VSAENLESGQQLCREVGTSRNADRFNRPMTNIDKEFSQQTIAYMEIALERACRLLPAKLDEGKNPQGDCRGDHQVRPGKNKNPGWNDRGGPSGRGNSDY